MKTINVKDYPYLATGDGKTDDLPAINAARAAASHAKLEIPDGNSSFIPSENLAGVNYGNIASGSLIKFVYEPKSSTWIKA